MKNFRYQTTAKIKSYIKLKTLLWLLPIVAAGCIGLFYNGLPERVPIFFSLPWGEDRLAAKIGLFVIPIIMIGINVANSLISVFLKKRSEDYLVNVLITSSFVCNLLALITIVQIIIIVS